MIPRGRRAPPPPTSHSDLLCQPARERSLQPAAASRIAADLMRPIADAAALKCTLPAFHPNSQTETLALQEAQPSRMPQMLASNLALTNLAVAAQQSLPHAGSTTDQRLQQDVYGVVDDLALANLQQVRSLIEPPNQNDIIRSLENTIGGTSGHGGAATHGGIANLAGLPAASSSVSSPRQAPVPHPQQLKTSSAQAFPYLQQPQSASHLKTDVMHFSQAQNQFRQHYHRPASSQRQGDHIPQSSHQILSRSSSHHQIGHQPAVHPALQANSYPANHRLSTRAHPPPAYSSTQLPPSKRHKVNDGHYPSSQPFASSPVNPNHNTQAIQQQRLLQSMATQNMQNIQNMHSMRNMQTVQNMQSMHSQPNIHCRNLQAPPHPSNPLPTPQQQVLRNLQPPPQYRPPQPPSQHKPPLSHSVPHPHAKRAAPVSAAQHPHVRPLTFDFQPQPNQENNPHLAYAHSPNYSDTSSSPAVSGQCLLRSSPIPPAAGVPSPSAPSPTGARHVCPHGCGRAYARAHSLSVHVSTKHACAAGASPASPHAAHACASCGKVFNRKDTLKRHVATMHERQRRWACGVCGRRFGQQAHLNTHVRCVHRKDRPFACDACPKAFGTLYNLNAHKNTHRRTQKAFACGGCRKTYKIKSSLARHRRKAAHPAPRGEEEAGAPAQAQAGAQAHAPVLSLTAAQSLVARGGMR